MTRKPRGKDRKQLLCQPRAPTPARGWFLLLGHNSHSHLLESYFTKLLWDVTETDFRGTASGQHCQALPAPTTAAERPERSHDPGTVHHRLQVPSALEQLLPHRVRMGTWRLQGRGSRGRQQDLQVSRWTAHFTCTPKLLLQPRARSCILTSSCHRPPTSSYPLSPLWWQPPDRSEKGLCHLHWDTNTQPLPQPSEVWATCRALTGCKPTEDAPKASAANACQWFPNSFKLIPLPTTVSSPGRKGCSTWEKDKPQP